MRRACGRKSTRCWSISGADGTRTFPCRFASRPAWSWCTTARCRRARSFGTRCPPTATSCIARWIAFPSRPAISTPRGVKRRCCSASRSTWRWRPRAKGNLWAGTSRCGAPATTSYPVDENEKFFVDGEQEPSVEFQGLEDSFGFSWGFPESQSSLPWTGFYPFFKGACGYRFFTGDAIPFREVAARGHRFRQARRARIISRSTASPRAACSSPAPCIGIRRSRMRRFRRCLRPRSAPAPEDRLWPGKKAVSAAGKMPLRQNLKEGGNALVSKSECVAKK